MKTTVKELLSGGYSCSQTMMIMTMRRLGIEDENLDNAMKGLSGGMGIQHACGIVTGAACAFSLADPTRGIQELFPSFYEMFYDAYGNDVGGINCIELLKGDFESRKRICPGMIQNSWDMADAVLKSYGL